MARPSGLNDIAAKKVCDAIARGNSRACAARLAGVTSRTIANWMRSSPEFLRKVREADAKAEDMVVDALYRLATGEDAERPHFEALKFWLKTRRAKTWRELPPPKEQEADLSAVETERLWEAVEKLRPRKETGT